MGVTAAAVESEHLVGFLVEDHTGQAAAGAAVDVEVVYRVVLMGPGA